ncbi:hypothetical protein ACVWXO_001797 [Bradyrhizobium sp. LM2.7]
MQRRTTPFEPLAFGLRAAVIPQDRRAQRTTILAEQRRAMHLAGQPDAADLRDLARMMGCKIVDGADRRIDPGVGILLGPQRRWVRQRELARRRRDNRAGFAHEHRFHTGRADVHSEIHTRLVLPC